MGCSRTKSALDYKPHFNSSSSGNKTREMGLCVTEVLDERKHLTNERGCGLINTWRFYVRPTDEVREV